MLFWKRFKDYKMEGTTLPAVVAHFKARGPQTELINVGTFRFMSGSTFKRADPTYWSQIPMIPTCFFCFLYGRGKLLGCWAQKQAMRFRQFQVVWSILKSRADLQAFQFCSACAHSSEMGPRIVGTFKYSNCLNPFIEILFFGAIEAVGRFPV